MKAIILAAGRGSRLGALTHDKPKCLVNFNGSPLIVWQTHALLSAGIKDIAIVSGYQSELLSPFAPIQLYNANWASTNMVFSLLQADHLLKADICIISYSDIYYTTETIMHILQSEGDITVPYYVKWQELWQARFEDPLRDAESFKKSADGLLTAIGEPLQALSDAQGQYMGLLKITPTGWHHVCQYLKKLTAEEIKKLQMTHLLHQLVLQQVKINTIPISEKWYEFDTPSDLLHAQNEMASC